jgi:hypothetical protein
MPKLNPGQIQLGLYDLDVFRVITALTRGSVAANIGSIVTKYNREMMPKYEPILVYTAGRLGMTRDELFARLRAGQSVDDIIKEKGLDLSEVRIDTDVVYGEERDTTA